MFFGSCDFRKISSSESSGSSTIFFNCPSPVFLSFFFSSHSKHHIQNGFRKALRSACRCFFLLLIVSCLTLFRTTVAPSPSWSLLSTTTSIWSWSRLRLTLPLPSTPALSTRRSTPLARSLPSRVPTVSTSLRPLPLLSMVCEPPYLFPPTTPRRVQASIFMMRYHKITSYPWQNYNC